MLWIRINSIQIRIQIRIQHFKWIQVQIRIRIQSGSRDWWPKIAIYLSLGLDKGRPRYRRSLQPSKQKIQHLKKINFFLFWWAIFALLDPDRESGYGSRDPIESGSNPDPDPQHCWKSWVLYLTPWRENTWRAVVVEFFISISILYYTNLYDTYIIIHLRRIYYGYF